MSPADSVTTALTQFRQTLKAGRLAHAYLIHGPVRDAGLQLLDGFLPLLFCRAQEPPCGECAECRRVAAHAHPDVLRLEPESKARLITIGEQGEEEGVRKLIRFISLTPFIGPWKVGVILDADRMNAPAANAFLKTLEEPPPSSLLFLLTESPQSLPATILSRCQKLMVTSAAPADEPWREALLEWLRAGPAADPFLSSTRGGRLGQILDAERQRVVEEETDLAKAEGADKDVILARVGARYRSARALLLKEILLWHRDVLMRVLKVETAGFHFAAEAEPQQRQAIALTPAGALADLQRLEKLIQRLERFPEASEAALLAAGLPLHPTAI